MEIVEGLMLKPDRAKVIPSIAYEQELLHDFPRYLSALKFLGVELPIVVFLTLVDIKGYMMATDTFFLRDSYAIDRDVLLLPEFIVESFDAEPQAIFKPAFDAIWNACGFAGSLNYNDKGEWKPRRFP